MRRHLLVQPAGPQSPRSPFMVPGTWLVPSPRRSLARRLGGSLPSRLGLTERAPRGRPGRSRRFLTGPRLLAQGARGAARALLPARRAPGAPALPSCPTMARTPKERPGLGVSTWAASRFGVTVESGGRSCCLGPTCAFCVVPFRSYIRSSCNLTGVN